MIVDLSGFSRVLTWSGTGVDSVAYCFNPQEKCEKKFRASRDSIYKDI